MKHIYRLKAYFILDSYDEFLTITTERWRHQPSRKLFC